MVGAFVDDVSAALESAQLDFGGNDRPLTSPPPSLRDLVISEAFNLCVAFIDVDERHADTELWALIETFAPLLPGVALAGATPAALRDTEMIAGKRTWLASPTTLYNILVTCDARNATAGATIYYHRAMDLTHLIASMDVLTTKIQLEALGRYRTMLLGHLRANGPASATPTQVIPETATGTASAPDPAMSPPRPIEDLMAELDGLVGLDSVKAEVRLVGDLLRVGQLRTQHGLPTIDTSLHLVFVGNPGTGKTTVARLLAQIYRSLGALATGQLVETDRSKLVAGFVGQTAPLVVQRFDEAAGGMLFIDEAYTLSRGGDSDFGREAIDTIVKLMEDRRESVALVVAGYPDEMADLIAANPGLKSRFPKTISFPDYSTDELLAIFGGICAKQRYELDESGLERLRSVLDSEPRDKGFGNGRFARNLFEASVSRHATRVARIDAPTDDDLERFHPDDIGPGPAEVSPPWPPPPPGAKPAQLPSSP